MKSIQRLAAQDIEMRGKQIKKDDRIRWFISSANRDPNKFERPDEMDITRWPNPHVAFGAGIHHCLGATIARVEGQEVFRELAERYPNMELGQNEMDYEPASRSARSERCPSTPTPNPVHQTEHQRGPRPVQPGASLFQGDCRACRGARPCALLLLDQPTRMATGPA